MNILVIAGTEDARHLVARLAELAVQLTVTVTTDYGASLIEAAANIDVVIGKWDAAQMQEEMARRHIALVIDASHPYAQNASQNAMLAAEHVGIDYWRYERQSVVSDDDAIEWVDDIAAAVDRCHRHDGTILLTIGSNHLPAFAEGLSDFSERVYVRILPTATMVARAEAIGLTPKKIIAMQGPFSESLNRAMIEQIGATLLVTKASGTVGGTEQKICAAKVCGIDIVIIRRPPLEYQQIFRDADCLISACRQYLKSV